MQAVTTNCSTDVSSGIAGMQANAAALDGPQYGAKPVTTTQGTIETP
jgi:hypothetical protein